MKRKVLGRGLEALISQDLRESVTETERVKELSIDRIDPNPHQPRDHFDEEHLRELAVSIRRHGLLQPIVVRHEGDRYQLVIGERRLRASRLAGRASVPAIVRDVTDRDTLKYALMENLQREDLSPIEEARGYRSLRDEFGLSVKEIAEILGKDRSTIANTLRLLNLPDSVVALIAQGRLSAGHARALLSVVGEEAQVEWARRIIEEGITVREVERTVPSRGQRKKARGRRHVEPQISAIEERIESYLGTRVRIRPRRRGGIISIEYYSREELEHVLEKIGIDLTF